MTATSGSRSISAIADRIAVSRFPIPVEIKVLDPVGTPDQRITAPCIEKGGDNRVALQIGTPDNQGKLMRKHVHNSLL